MILSELLAELKKYRVVPQLNDGGIDLVGATEDLPAAFIQLLKDRKEELISYLSLSAGQMKAVPIKPIGAAGSYATTNGQERLWLLSQLEGGNQAYNITTALEIRGNIRSEYLSKAFELLVKRHEILRTVFIENGQGLRQVILPESPFELLETGVPEEEGEKEISGFLRQEVEQYRQQTFDLERGPLLRGKLIKVSDQYHVLLVSVHHIVGDGVSLNLLLQEVLLHYRQLCQDVDYRPDPLPIQYKDYTDWFNRRVKHWSVTGFKEFWKNQFLDGSESLNLPYDFSRPTVKTFAGAVSIYRFDKQLSGELTKFCKARKVTHFTVFQLVVTILLNRLSGQQDITIGIPVAGRNHPDLVDQIGLYINTLPIRNRIEPEHSFENLLQEVAKNWSQVFQYQEYPFGHIVEAVQPARESGRNPLFDVLLVYQDLSWESNRKSSEEPLGPEVNLWKDRSAENKVCTYRDVFAKFDLSFSFTSLPDKTISLEIEYATDLFKHRTIDRFYRCFLNLLRQVLAHPDRLVRELKLVDERESQVILEEFNQPATVIPSGATLVSLFEDRVRCHPQAKALQFGEKILTYSELNELSNRMGHYLREQFGVGPGDVVGLCLERSPALVISLWGVLKAGAAYLPIDQSYPKERKDYMFKDSGSKMLIDYEAYQRFEAEAKNLSPADPQIKIDPVSLAYIMYTSGSTGKPKGVMIEHRNAVSFFHNLPGRFFLKAGMVMGATTNYTFDISVLELLGTLTCGMQIILFASDEPHVILNLIREGRLDALQLTPSRLNQLLEAADGRISELSNLEVLLVGGEPLGADNYSRLKQLTSTKVINVYGPTETTIWSSMLEVGKSRELSIGRPLLQEYIYILDAYDNLLPVGVAGEICIGGAGLARGYLQRPELTVERFVDNPFRPGEKMYRTGDLGSWLPDGNLSFIGRIDDQVKIRGHRIESGEIEHALNEFPGIESAVVIARKVVDGELDLVAYFKGSSGFGSTALRKHLGRFLPVYMIPTYFVRVAEFPLKVNGKLDRGALPSPELNRVGTGTDFLGPRSFLEQQLTGVWAEILGLSPTRIGVHDSFFDLGGHSVRATKLLSQLRRQFEVEIRLNDLFVHTDVAAQAAFIEAASTRAFDEIPVLVPAQNYILSSSQRRLWILSQFAASNAAYNMSGVYIFEGQVNVKALSFSFRKVLERHEILRTLFVRDATGNVRQQIKGIEELEFELVERNLRRPGEMSLEDSLSRDVTTAFDLSEGPLLRATLNWESEHRCVFSFVMHHIISDGWSMEILVREVLEYYRRFVEQDQSTLPDLRIQYKDYAQWQEDNLAAPFMAGHRIYWENQFADPVPVVNLAIDLERPKIKTYRGGIAKFPLGQGLRDKLLMLGSQVNATLFMVLLTGVKAMIYRLAGLLDIVIGTPMAGRDHLDLQDQIGFYANTLALRTRFDASASFKSLLNKVKEVTLKGYEHQSYPFDRLVEGLSLARDRSRHPLFDIQVILEQGDTILLKKGHSAPGFTIREFEGQRELHSVFDLVFTFVDSGTDLDLELTYNIDVYTKAEAEVLMKRVSEVLEAIVVSPDVRLSALEFVSKEERAELLQGFNDTAVVRVGGRTLIDLLESSVRQYGTEPALYCAGKTVSYAELWDRSDRLASYLLQEFGVDREQLVGLLARRGIDAVVGMLGILKSGCAYVPIDPSYPRDRKKYLIEDTGVEVLLTESSELLELDYYSGQVIALDIQLETLPVGDLPEDAGRPSARDLAYVIYTSGSTGRPKGVQIEHRQIVNTILSQVELFEAKAGEHHLQFASLGFDASVSELFVGLAAGACLYLVKDEVKRDGEQLGRYLAAHDISLATLPPGFARQLDMSQLQVLDRLVTAGEAADAVLADAFLSHGTYINAYGPTEASICATANKYGRGSTLTGRGVPIGRPISNVRIYLLSEGGKLQPVGAIGEICIGGEGVGRGYLGQESLTRERFVADPYQRGGRIYKTGDLGRWLTDGRLEFLGRKDEQLKLRGYRIEPGEIEQVLLERDEIKAAAVLVRGRDTDKSLVAYVDGAAELKADELRDYLGQRLPAYMVPSDYIRIAEMPLTTSGKVDKKALLEIDGADMRGKVAFIPPRSEVEIHLVSIYEEVLQKTGLGIKAEFFSLGGDSIKSIQVVSRLKQRGYSLSIQDVLNFPVIETLSKKVRTESRASSQEIYTGPVDLTPIQYYFFEQYPEGNHHYNQSVLLKGRDRLSSTLLQACLSQLVLHHDALRMVYRKEAGEWLQVNLGAEQSFGWLELELDDEAGFVENCERLQAGMDLSVGPLFHAGLFHLPEEDRLLLVAHHLVVDGVSWRILVEDLVSLYDQGLRSEKFVLPLKTDGYAYWAEALCNYSQGGVLKREKVHWSNLMENVSREGFPVDFDGGSNRVEDRQFCNYQLSEDHTLQLLTRVNHIYNTDVNDILVTALVMTLERKLGVSRVSLQMEGHGRETIGSDADISRTIGWFTSVYPILIDANSRSLLEQLVYVKEHLHRVPGKGIGFGILKYLAGEAFGSEVPPISFNYLGDFGAAQRGQLSKLTYGLEYQGARIDPKMEREVFLDVSGMIVNGKLNLEVGYSSKQYMIKTIKSLSSTFGGYVEELIDTLSAADRRLLTPIDLTYAALSIEDVNALNDTCEIEDVYGLSPLQEGLYYHWSSSQDESSYLVQTNCRLRGLLDPGLLERSYYHLVSRHAALRTFYTQNHGDRLLQVVLKDVESGFHFLSAAGDSGFSIPGFKEADRRQGFDLNEGSQMRLTVLELQEGEFEFVWSHHHILMDGWCGAVLIEEFFKIYCSLRKGETPLLGQIEPYSGYIRWLDSLDRTAGLEYWKNYLAGFESICGIPRIASPPEAGIAEFGSTVLHLEQHLTKSMKDLCMETGVTESVFMQTVWALLLGRYNNTDDIVFGAVVSGRPPELDGVEEIVGLFSNTVPVRIRLNPDQSAISLLRRVQEDGMAGHPHHHLQLAEVQLQSEIGGDLFETLLVFENYPRKNDFIYELEKESVELVSYEVIERTNYDLTVTVQPGHQFEVRFDYDLRFHDDKQIAQLKRHFICLIEEFLNHPDKLVVEFDGLPEEQTLQMLGEFNSTQANYDEEATLISLFEAQVKKTPDDIALSYGEQSMTYQQLNRLSNRLGGFLRSRYGIGRDDLVGVSMPRSPGMIVCLLGVLKSGGAYVPVDPVYPRERKDYIRDNSNYKVMLDSALYTQFKECRHEFCDRDLEPVNMAEDLAYVIYTSGSTGRPKGVLIQHDHVVRLLTTDRSPYDFGPEDVWPLFHSFCFDVSVWEMYGALLFGGRLVIVPFKITRDPGAFLDLLVREKVTILNQTPSAFYPLADAEMQRPIPELGLRYVIFAGEALSPEQLSGWKNRYPGTRLINMYGITETTVHVTFREITEHDIQTNASNVGRPLPTLKCYILDRCNRLCPVGVEGEICVSGTGVARGYLNQPELTKERFTLDPFCDGHRMYHSGDLGRWMPDGTIECKGRMDHQVKIRGYRVELGEISHVLEEHPGVGKALVLALGERGEQDLAAYVNLRDGVQPAGLREYLQERLPDYMVPTYYVPVQEFPLTPNGKLDKRALPVPWTDGIKVASHHVDPRNETEMVLAKMWSKVLPAELSGIGVHDSFFALGGHSLKVMRLLNLIKKDLGVGVSLEELFHHPTLEGQARLIDRSSQEAFQDIPLAEDQGSYPLSSAQRRLWLLQQISGSGGAYNMPGFYEFAGTLERTALASSLKQLVERHEILRTIFVETEAGEVRQVVRKPEDVEVAVVYCDFKGQSGEALESAMLADARADIDLSSGPLLLVKVYQISDELSTLSFVLHHIAGDAWSMNLLFEELTLLYQGSLSGKVEKLSPLRIQYKDYAYWQNEQLTQPFMQKQRQFWLSEFAGEIPVLELPGDVKRPAVRTYNGSNVKRLFPPGLSDALNNHSSEKGITMFMLLQTGLKALLYRYTEQSDLIVGTTIAGRDHADLERQVGFYVNTLALRTRFGHDETFEGLLDKVQDTTLMAYQHRLYPFDSLLEDLDLRRDMSRHPLFDVMLVMQNANDQTALHTGDFGNLPVRQIKEVENHTSKFDLSFVFEENADGLLLDLEYNSDIFSRGTAQRMGEHLENLLSEALDRPGRPISDLSFLAEGEQELVRDVFSQTADAVSGPTTLVALFEQQVLSSPQARAVIGQSSTLTYNQLNERVNSFSRCLEEKFRIQRGDLVGVCLDRSPAMIITILAILKSGAAYVPIDPDYPMKRQQFMVSDSECKVLINNELVAQLEEQSARFSTANPPLVPKPEDLAYVIYTSGSTGQPKGCMLTHDNISNYVQWANTFYFDEARPANFGLFTSLSFDLTVTSIYCSLLGGGCLQVFPSSGDLLDILRKNFLSTGGLNSIKLTPSHVRMLHDFKVESTSVKVAIVGGEAFGPEELSILKRIDPAIKVYNEYGPTETSVGCVVRELSEGEPVTIGKPISGASVHVLDAANNLCPIGVPGEICIGGRGVGVGYLKRPDLSAGRFIDHPFQPGQRLYKTGDRGCWTPNGDLNFIGRSDRQVKIRGYRIELGEVEHLLEGCPGVLKAVVLPVDRSEERALLAYIQGASEITVRDIRDYLTERIPHYLIPAYFVAVESFPLTVNGKIDVEALPSPEGLEMDIGIAYVPPGDVTQEKLVEIWSTVLERQKEEIGIQHNFFDLGGDSLKALRVVSMVRKEFGTQLNVKALFERPTIESISEDINNAQWFKTSLTREGYEKIKI